MMDKTLTVVLKEGPRYAAQSITRHQAWFGNPLDLSTEDAVSFLCSNRMETFRAADIASIEIN